MSNQNPIVNMITQQLRTGDVLNENILSLFETLARDAFVPAGYQAFAWSDMHIPLAGGECMMTPLEEGLLMQALQLEGHETVLEVGTGTGFLTAMLSRQSASVLSVDCNPEFTRDARKRLAEHGCDNVELITGDACRGWMAKAPYDVVVFTGALEALTESHFLQVVPGGRLFAIIGNETIQQARLFSLSHDEKWRERIVFETCLPALKDNLKKPRFDFDGDTRG